MMGVSVPGHGAHGTRPEATVNASVVVLGRLANSVRLKNRAAVKLPTRGVRFVVLASAPSRFSDPVRRYRRLASRRLTP